MIRPSALLAARRRRGHVRATLAAAALGSGRVDSHRPDLHAQLLPLLRPLRCNLPPAAIFARDARLGAALLAPLGCSVASGLAARPPLPLRARASRLKHRSPSPRLPFALARAPCRLPDRRLAAARRGLPRTRLDLDGLQLPHLLQPPERLHVLRHDPARRLHHGLLPALPGGGVENLPPRSGARPGAA